MYQVTDEMRNLFELAISKLGGDIRKVEITEKTMCNLLNLAMLRYNEYVINFIIDANWSNFYGKTLTNKELAYAFSMRTLGPRIEFITSP